MGKYIFRRLLLIIPVLFGMTIINFFFMNIAPGDPAYMYINWNDEEGISEEKIELIHKQLGLDGNIFTRYCKWVGQLLHGNLGFSYQSYRPVVDEILSVIPATITLNALIMLLACPLGICIGIYCALHKYKTSDYIITFITFIGRSVPAFWMAMIVILIFSYKLQWLPSMGLSDPLLLNPTKWERFVDTAKHYIMPVCVGAFSTLTSIARSQRGYFLDVMNQDYIRTARSKGLGEPKINFVHTLKNASLPIINMVSGLIPSLLGGSFMIENVFGIRGMGRLSTHAVFNRDYPILMGTCFAYGIIGLLCSLLSEILYAFVDPRVRFS